MDPSLFNGNLVKSRRIIYTPSDFAKANLIHLQEAGELQARKAHVSRRKDLSSYLFFLVLSGEGMLEYGGKTYPVKKGDYVYINCHKEYAHSTSEKLWRLKWVHFYGPNVNGIYEKYVERGGSPVHSAKDPDACEALIDRICEIAASDSYVRDMQIFEKLTSLLTLLMEQSWDQREEGEDKKHTGRLGAGKKQDLQDVKEYLDKHYSEKITLDALAERFYINKFYLTRIFKEQFGETVSGYLLQVRITHAKQQLRFEDKAIEEIARGCGMSDANYFSRVFKKVEGVTPGEFRRIW